MLRAGYTSVGEFHYLHADPRGAPYADPNELAKRVIAAAEDVGIRIRLIDAAYATGGIGQPLAPPQRRFATHDRDRWLEQVARLGDWAARGRLASVGVAAHSVRAVPADWLAPIHAFACAHDLPFHSHASEQPAEVVACEAAYGLRPVELLAERGVLDGRTTLVHATHISAREVSLLGIAATVCACPTTERDLGDGFLQADALVSAGARIAIGSDSQTVIDPLEEIRLIEYHERLRTLRRVVLAERGEHGRADVAPRLLSMGTVAGARSLRLEAGDIADGALADLIAIDLDHPALAGWTPASLPALLALSAPAEVVTDVWVGGVQRIADRRHAAEDSAAAAFTACARRLA
jgi:formimidoylglutamate deiminase